MTKPQATPEVTWAQRSSTTDSSKNIIYLTIIAPDVPEENTKLEITSTSLTFTGESNTKPFTYHVHIDFFGEIDTEKTKKHHTDRDIEIVLTKKELKQEYWSRLLKESKKAHYLKTNFDKWVDEDEQEGAVEESNDYMNQYGGGEGMGGMPGMGDMGGMGGEDGAFGGIDFSKLGGGAMGGMPGMPGMGGLGADDEDEDMPDLEGEEATDKIEESVAKSTETPATKATETKAAPKIEEVE